VSEQASRLSVHPSIRHFVNERLRAAAAAGGVVVEGRDIGTVVLPDADVKIFLSASIEVRAERRRRDLEATGHGSSPRQVADDLDRRDRRDAGRDIAPLSMAAGAVLIDGTSLTFEEQVEAVLAEVARKRR
jgi:cytidylate kinase